MTNYPQAILEFGLRELGASFASGEGAWYSEEFPAALEKEGSNGYWMKRIDIAAKAGYRRRKPYFFAECYARLGNKVQALDCLEEAFAAHDSMEHLLVDEFWSGFREEPRFQAVLRNVGLDRWAP